MRMKLFLRKTILAVIFLVSQAGMATHNRAGEIIYKRIPPFSEKIGGITVAVYNYSITVIKYTDHDNIVPIEVADRCVDTVDFGDGTRGVAPRINGGLTLDCDCPRFNEDPQLVLQCGEIITQTGGYTVKKNIYTITHRYPGPGHYILRSLDPNRNKDVVNIQNSVDKPFYIESMLMINAHTGANSSPVFAFAPIDKACQSQCFEHNPGAFDPDGDSLSYQITTSRGADGQTVSGYSYPSGSYGMDAVTGELRWCTPSLQGEYNLAFIVFEWRKNTNGLYEQIGYVLRDMQVIVESCPLQHPPQAQVPPDTCVEAGSNLVRLIGVTDSDGDRVTIEGGGAPFENPPPIAILENTEGSGGGSGFTGTFRWQTSCEHIRRLPYQVTIKAQDNSSPVKQVSFSTFNIRIVPPAITNMTAEPAGSTIKLSWSAPFCQPQHNSLSLYQIYRRNSCDSITIDPCNNSPLLNGYKLIGQCGRDTTFFVDDNNGDGLVVGQNYNYIVTALYKDGSESFASAGVCSELRRDVPVLLNVDVQVTSVTAGEIFTRWARPLTTEGNFDSIANPGPYTFRLVHRDPAGNQSTIFTSTAQSLYQPDPSYQHTGINTTQGPHEYQVEFLAGDATIGSSQRASSVFLRLRPDDRRMVLEWIARTPWTNESYNVYRMDAGATSYSLIGTATGTVYTDSANVQNGFVYCYHVESKGAYSDPGIFRPLINFSQDTCGIPRDLTPPCTPSLELAADCPAGYVRLAWTDVARVCGRSSDLGRYILYHKPTVNDEYIKVDEGVMIQYEFTNLPMVSGCYAVQAIDTNNNSSGLSPSFCIDNCPIFELPNVFTPNEDGTNDAFKAIRVRHISEISLTIVDRWGNTIYQSRDPYFEWNGISSLTRQPCDEGTYFYICEVFEPRLQGVITRPLKGTVQLIR